MSENRQSINIRTGGFWFFLTVFMALTLGEPDLLDGLIKMANSP